MASNKMRVFNYLEMKASPQFRIGQILDNFAKRNGGLFLDAILNGSTAKEMDRDLLDAHIQQVIETATELFGRNILTAYFSKLDEENNHDASEKC